MGKATGLGGAIARWEKFRFNPPPSCQQLEVLTKIVGVNVYRLQQILPPAGVGMNLEPIRLCAVCYIDLSCHKIAWQLKVTQKCECHKLGLLSECPYCGARFKAPALWIYSWCHRCFTTFADMAEHQKSV